MTDPHFDSCDPQRTGWQARLAGLRAVYAAYTVSDVRAVLARADEAATQGCWAAVMVAYEAAPAFDAAMTTPAPAPELPLVWVAVYDEADLRVPPATAADAGGVSALDAHASVARDEYVRRVGIVQEQIREGLTYQANLTFRLEAPAPADTAFLYASLRHAQQAAYCASLDMGRFLILCFSPELFFERTGSRLTMRPMKGTAPRGRWHDEDRALAAQLRDSAKAHAENVMIVDLLRNDAGRLARPGSVRTPHLFTLERYPTLWQLTSTVESEIPVDTTIVGIFSALFPCGSVTGVPKIRTMALLAELEARPRGVYTGAIGVVRPGGACTFSVAIRTVVIDRESGTCTLGVGAGITTDSNAEEEYRECVLKGTFATGTATMRHAPFSLVETMRLEDGVVPRIERHVARMRASAEYFGFTWDDSRVTSALERARADHAAGIWRVRLLVDAGGSPLVTCTAHDDEPGRRWRVAIAETPVDERSPFLFNKTTTRDVYDAARRQRPDADDVLLWNTRGDITESTIANVVIELDGAKVTPPILCGLLGGVAREETLARGEVIERVITKDDLARASRVWLLNSLRGWREADLID
ncbi:MAG: aminodeoxychorismate synthase component I [Acidobacteria bacterium]|nr:aminodeoxychorismate synthase component I [Acidobacteriota bacterium]